jgi:ferrous iron transport protein B
MATPATQEPPARQDRDPARPLIVALLGNPNTGKTTLFNALAGMRQQVGNYPGVTVEKKHGRFRHADRDVEVIDLPGTYSLAPRSPDEMVAVDVILGHQAGEQRPDVVVSIVDASNLERNLYLTTQLLELDVPIVVALNMVDIAERQGRPVDAVRLAQQLGLPVVAMQANKKRGIDDLKTAIVAAGREPRRTSGPEFPAAFEAEVHRLREAFAPAETAAKDPVPSYHWRRVLLDVGGHTETRLARRFGPSLQSEVRSARERLSHVGCPVPAVEARTRYAWLRQRVAGCVVRSQQATANWSDRIDRVLTHRISGLVAFLALMFVVFVSLYWLAQYPMEWIDAGLGVVSDLVRAHLPPGPFRSLLVDGVVAGVGGVLVFLPQIVVLFGFIAILEDCGYMARAAFLMDKIMARCGLSGKSFIPLLSSFACAIPGVMATRVIEDRRDRLATILVAPLMSCSARLPVYVLLTAAFIPTDTTLGLWLPGLTLFAMYLVGLVVAPLVAWALKRTLLRGETPAFVMELPPYKVPSLRLVLFRMYDRGKAFVRRAGTIILASMIVVWALLYFPFRDTEGRSYEHRLAELEEQIVTPRQELEDLESQIQDEPPADVASRMETLEAIIAPVEEEMHQLQGEWKRQSLLGRAGRWIEPAVEPLGWDWRIGMAALASFPAREVVVGTLGIIYDVGEGADQESDSLREKLQAATWQSGPRTGSPVFTIPTALSLMVFFALCCQCASTLAVIRRETNSWRWPVFTFVYMTILAYVGALLTYQMGTWISTWM